jgi:hypothetical protein
MADFKDLNSFSEIAEGIVGKNFYSDSWRSTSLLIQLLYKADLYMQSMIEQHPGCKHWMKAQVAANAACDLVSNAYKVPTSDERFELVQEVFEVVVDTWITEISDDAMMDFLFIGRLANFTAKMRVHAWNALIEETAPSEQKFQALQLAKRDAVATEMAFEAIAEAMTAELTTEEAV